MLVNMVLLVYSPALCEQKWKELNSWESITKQEFRVCKKDIYKEYKRELKVEYRKYKRNLDYCSDKYQEINYRRNPTLAENRLCKKEFMKIQKSEIEERRKLLKARGIEY